MLGVFFQQKSIMQSPDWSHVANPSRCYYCRSEYHLSSDELYPLQLALTQIPLHDRPRYRGHEHVIMGSRVQGKIDSIRWWAGGEDCWWTDSAAETIGVEREMCGSTGSEVTSEDGGSGLCFEASRDNSLELSDLERSGPQSAESESPRRWSDNFEEEWNMDDEGSVRRDWSGTGQRLSGDGHRRSWSPTGREWVVRRRSDGSRYIGRRRDSAGRRRSVGQRRTDPARRSQSRSSINRSPSTYDHQHGFTGDDSSVGVERKTEDAIDAMMTLDRRNAADHEDYSTVEWICSPHWTDSSCRVVAVI